MSFEARHGKQTIENGIHGPVSFEYANEAAREAGGPFDASDKYKLAWQIDTQEIYILVDETIPTWALLSAGDGYIPSHASRHEKGGSDEIEISDLITSETNTTFVLKPDGSGGVLWAQDSGSIDGYVPETRQVIAGAGLSGGGSLISNVTINIVANADGSIVVNANDIQVGTLANDSQHGNLGGGSLHDLANGFIAGFLSPDGYVKLEGIESGAQVNTVNSVFGRTGNVLASVSDYDASQIDNDSNVPGIFVDDALNYLNSAVYGIITDLDGYVSDTRQVIAGAGLTGGGDLSDDRTFNIVANADGSIVVNANDIQVGTLANDSQHGNLGGGSLHDLANGSVAGFLSPDGYVKLEGIESGAQVNTVNSVFGRTGNVLASVSDYDASQIDNNSNVPGAYVSDALDYLDGYISSVSLSFENHSSRHEFNGSDQIDGYNLELTYSPSNYNTPQNNKLGEHIAAIDDALAGAAFGDVVGPASSTDSALVRFDGITGKLIQNSTATLTDDGYLSLDGGITVGADINAINHTVIVGEGVDLSNIYQVNKEPSGFETRDYSTISFDNNNRSVTISPVSGTFDFYIRGVKFTRGVETVNFADIEGIHFFAFDDTGTFVTTRDHELWLDWVVGDGALVAALYWDSTNQKVIFFAEERHGFMDGRAHAYFHQAFSARWFSGGDFTNFTLDTDGSDDGYAQFGVNSVVISDEDLRFEWTNGNPQQMNSPAEIPIYYLDGPDGYWRVKDPDTFPLIYSGTAGYTGANGRIPYNYFNGSSWELVEADQNHFVLLHYYASDNLINPIIGIQGQFQYANVFAASEAASQEIRRLSGLARLLGQELVPLGTVLFETSDTYINTPKAAIYSTVSGASYVDFRRNDVNGFGSESPQVIFVRKNSNEEIGGRGKLNFIEGSGISLSISDDAVDDEIDIVVSLQSIMLDDISFVNSSTNTVTGTSNITLSVPAGAEDGYFMLAIVCHAEGAEWTTPPAQWNQYINNYLVGGAPGTPPGISVWYRVANSEPANYTWTSSNSSSIVGSILVYSGVNPTVPFDVFPAFNNAGSGTPDPGPTTTVTDGSFIVAAGFKDGSAAITDVSLGYNSRVNLSAVASGGSDGCAMAICDFEKTTAGLEDPGAFTAPTDEWGAITLALRPNQQIIAGGDGNVIGPGSSTDNALVRFDGVTGKLIQNSNATLSDLGALTLTLGLTVGGNIDVGSNSITNVNLVDGVDVSAHASRHNPGGADAISTAAASGLNADSTNTEGNATSVARSNHTHAIDTTGTLSTVNAGDVAVDGTATGLARKDHQHPVSTGVASTLSGSNSEGVSTSLARADHNHALGGTVGGDLSGTLPNPTVVDLTISGEEQGSILYYNGANWVQLAPGTDGYALITNGPGANPEWGQVATESGGTVGGDLSGTLPNPTVVDLTIVGEQQGSILYYNGANWVVLDPGEDGYYLKSNGIGADPTWEQVVASATKKTTTVEFTLTEDVNNTTQWFTTWRSHGGDSPGTKISGTTSGIQNQNSCSPYQVPFNATITKAILTLKGAGVQNGSVSYPVTYQTDLLEEGFTSETKIADIDFSISNLYTVGTFSVGNTNFKGSVSLDIDVDEGDLLALKFINGIAANLVGQTRNAFITLILEER